jgi:AcrR family transcriptional regulator
VVSQPKRGVRPVSSTPRRSDAVANRTKVVAAARDAFASEGFEVSLDEIARRAGVGAGTVHRHFATKAELIDTVLAAAVDDLAVAAASRASSDDAGAALRAFVVQLVTEGATAHDLAARLHIGADDQGTALTTAVANLDRAMGVLLTRARAAGAIRDDIDERDLAAIVAAAHTAYTHPAGGDRALALVLRTLD